MSHQATTRSDERRRRWAALAGEAEQLPRRFTTARPAARCCRTGRWQLPEIYEVSTAHRQNGLLRLHGQLNLLSALMTASAPRLCCLDLDTFFVSVERLFDPTLEGKPVIVGGRPRQRGVVTACSYEARTFGVRSGMSLTLAAKLAPRAIYLPTRHDTYSEFSRRVVAIAQRYAPLVQVASIDELYMDLSGCERLYRQPEDASDDAAILRKVLELTHTIKREEGLPASVGIATSKRMAKVASGLAKPNGVLFIPVGQEANMLAPLPVRKLPGIGPVAERKLAQAGVSTLGELAMLPPAQARRIFGVWASQLQDAARGRGSSNLGRDRPAFSEHDPEGEAIGSISNERTFREDVSDERSIEQVLSKLSERVCFRARKRGIQARTITLKLRYADFQTLTRSRTVAPTCAERDVLQVVKGLLAAARTRPLPIRLLGIALSKLGHYRVQLSLFEPSEQLGRSVDEVRNRFGYGAVYLASSQAKPPPQRPKRPTQLR